MQRGAAATCDVYECILMHMSIYAYAHILPRAQVYVGFGTLTVRRQSSSSAVVFAMQVHVQVQQLALSARAVGRC